MEPHNCRCWAELTERKKFGPPDCREKEKAKNDAEDNLQMLLIALNKIEMRAKALKEEKDQIFSELVRVFGTLWATSIITAPLKWLDDLSEFIRRYFGMQIQNELQEHLDELGQQLKGIHKKISYLLTQKQILEAQIEKAKKDLQEAIDELQACLAYNA